LSSFCHSESAPAPHQSNHHLTSDREWRTQQRLLNVTQTLQSSDVDMEKSVERSISCSEDQPQDGSRYPKGYQAFVPTHLVGTPLEVTYKRIYEQIRKEVGENMKTQVTGDFPDLRVSLPVPGLDTPSNDFPGCFNLEQEFLEERKRCLKLKGRIYYMLKQGAFFYCSTISHLFLCHFLADLDWLKKQHEREIAELRRRHEGQLNEIKEELSSSNNQVK
jgi:hypothetical protein